MNGSEIVKLSAYFYRDRTALSVFMLLLYQEGLNHVFLSRESGTCGEWHLCGIKIEALISKKKKPDSVEGRRPIRSILQSFPYTVCYSTTGNIVGCVPALSVVLFGSIRLGMCFGGVVLDDQRESTERKSNVMKNCSWNIFILHGRALSNYWTGYLFWYNLVQHRRKIVTICVSAGAVSNIRRLAAETILGASPKLAACEIFQRGIPRRGRLSTILARFFAVQTIF